MNTKKIISTVLTLSLCAAPVCLSASAWKWPWQKQEPEPSSYEQLIEMKKEWDSKKESLALLPDFFQEISSLKDNTCYLNNTDNVYFNKFNNNAIPALQKAVQKYASKYGNLMDSFDENNKDEQQCNALLKKLREIDDRNYEEFRIVDQKFAKIKKEIPQAFWDAFNKDAEKIRDKYFPDRLPH